MKKNDKLQAFSKLLHFTNVHPNGTYKFIDTTGASLEATLSTVYETDNGCELDDPNYEEFIGIAFAMIPSGSLFEINYHNLPFSAYCDGEKVY